MMKKVLVGALAGALVLSLAACGGSSDSAAASSAKSESKTEAASTSGSEKAEATGDKKFKIGLSMPDVDDYGRQLLDAWQAACDERGIEFMYSDGEHDLETAISQVEDMVAAGCDFIAIRALDADALADAAEYCKEHGVPCAGCEFDVNSDACVSHFLFPETGVGEGAGMAVVQLLEENPDLVLKMGHIWVNSSIDPEQQRWSGFTSQLQEYIDNGRVVMLDEQESMADTSKVMTIAENWLTSQPEMNCVFGNNDGMAYAAAGVLASNGKNLNEDFWVFGVGGDSAGLNGVKEGVMYSTSVSEDMAERQAYWVELIYDYLNGEELMDSYTWSTPATPVTPNNIDDFV